MTRDDALLDRTLSDGAVRALVERARANGRQSFGGVSFLLDTVRHAVVADCETSARALGLVSCPPAGAAGLRRNLVSALTAEDEVPLPVAAWVWVDAARRQWLLTVEGAVRAPSQHPGYLLPREEA